MSTYTLKSLDASEYPAPGSLSSLVFHVAFPEHVPGQYSSRYEALRAERHLEDETHYDEASGRIALEAYLEDALRAERERWVQQATSVFDRLVQVNKSTLRHVELILPTGGIATPLNLLASVKEIAELESFCVQWPLRGYRPMTLMLMSQWSHIIEGSITAAFATFTPTDAPPIRARCLPQAPAHRAPALYHPKAIRRHVPQASHVPRPPRTRAPRPNALEPASRGSHDAPRARWPAPCPATPHHGPWGGDQPNGRRWPLRGLRRRLGRPVVETRSWPALGAFLAAHPGRLRSLSAALHDTRFSIGFAYRLSQTALRKLLGAAAVEDLVVCTAWPISYEAIEVGEEETR
ncbi:hypothetical protein B0H13DRAFT_1054125 [Mycena leptocephala]|nr:hypothetical protein B0H13DRAFT_1054125 [Mycena leptocephala]